jgi:predicted esterase YcpF (UPF0227 family)
MKILYVHGFGSRYDPGHEKIKLLATLGEVVGVDVNYCLGYGLVFDKVMSKVIDHKIDLVVGTSMGGYMSAMVGDKAGVPFVALNPAITPSTSLLKWVGNFTDHSGHDHHLTEMTASGFPDITTTGSGLVIVESNDEVIPASDTVTALRNHFHVEMFVGGSHRFVNMAKALPLITTHYNHAGNTYSAT